jgi:organic radical activating enzyme
VQQRVEQAAENEQIVNTKPLYFDVRLGNLCNLKCRMCNNIFSSQIEKDPVHSQFMSALPVLQGRFASEPWYDSDQLRDELFRFSDSVVQVQLAGGEPTINKVQMRWLEHLIEIGRAQEVVVQIWTNFTTMTPRFYSMISQFKSTSLMMSVDAHGPLLEYIRFPAKWATIEANMRRLRAEYPSISILVFPVFQMYNALQIVDLFEWAHGLGLDTLINRISGPHYLHYSLLPPESVALAVSRLLAYARRPRCRPKAGLSRRSIRSSRSCSTCQCPCRRKRCRSSASSGGSPVPSTPAGPRVSKPRALS